MNTAGVSTIFELLLAVFEMKARLHGLAPAWRGQADFDWPLETVFHREVRLRCLDERRWELTIVNEFVNQAHSRDPQTPPVADIPKWLVLMRHHGLPVRMLDWTWNPLMAAYFAVSTNPETDAALWALEVQSLNKHNGLTTGLGSLLGDEPELRQLVRFPFQGKDCPDRIFAVAAPESTRRIAVQHGLFTIHGTGVPLDQHPSSSGTLFKIRIRASAKEGIRKDLDYLGISRKFIFPDLDNLAAGITDAQRPSRNSA